MDCKRVVSLLSPYIDEALDEHEMQEVSIHLNGCPSCREELYDLKRTIEGIKQLEMPELPQDFHDGLMRKIRAVKRKKSGFYTWLPLGAAAVLLILFFNFGAGAEKFNSADMDNFYEIQESKSLNDAGDTEAMTTESGDRVMKQPARDEVENYNVAMDDVSGEQAEASQQHQERGSGFISMSSSWIPRALGIVFLGLLLFLTGRIYLRK